MHTHRFADRLRAAGIHLALSLLIAALAALVVFGLWYPAAYGQISGGRQLFVLLVSVDAVMGPLITLAVFDRRKPLRTLRRDLVVVALLQLSALAYGLWTVSVARPVHLVFEFDRFRVVHAIEVPDELIGQEPAGIVALPWTGPTLLAVRPFKNGNENFDATMAALSGIPLSARPDLWQPYEAALPRVLNAARPIEQLKARFPARAAEIDAALAEAGSSADAARYLPLAGRRAFWTVLLDARSGAVLAYLDFDSF